MISQGLGDNPALSDSPTVVPTTRAPILDKEIRYVAIGQRVAMIEVEPESGKRRIRRHISHKKGLRIWVDGDLVRPQQNLVGRRT